MTPPETDRLMEHLRSHLMTDAHVHYLAMRLHYTAEEHREAVIADCFLSLADANKRLTQMLTEHMSRCALPMIIEVQP